MKKAVLFLLVMGVIIVIMPMLIVRGCSSRSGSLPDDKKGIAVKVYKNTENATEELPLEEYIKGVVAAEMPAGFEMEALKAQAVAARTYAYGRLKKIYSSKVDTHNGADICTDSAHCQAWVSKENAMKKWGVFSSIRNWSKINKAVNETEGVIIVYNGTVVNPVFHSNSGGKTENSEDVWEGGSVPYLRSVSSSGEDLYAEFENIVNIKVKDFCSRMKSEYPGIKLNEKKVMNDITVLDYTEGGRVKNIKIGNTTIKGTEFRSIFSLKSANFKIEQSGDDALKITTVGNGHGVGMSQWGANYLAKNGGSYEEILKYYYMGVGLDKVEE